MDSLRSSKFPLGISLVYYGLWLVLVPLAIAVGVGLPGAIGSDDTEEFEPTFSTAAGTVFLVAIGVVLIGKVTLIVGKACCLISPGDLPGKGHLYKAVICTLIALLGGVVSRAADVPVLVGHVAETFGALGWALFAKFLEQFVASLRSSALTRRASGLVSICTTAVAIHALETVLFAFAMRGFSSLLEFFAVYIDLVVIVQLLRLLHSLRPYFAASTKQIDALD